MKLKKQLNLKSFRNKWEKTLLNFQLCNANINSYIRECFREEPITYTQFLVLKILDEAKEPVNMLFIKERLIDPDSDMSRLISRLTALDFVVKKANADDKRHSDLTISARGITQLESISQKIHAIDEVFFNLNAKEVKQLNALLNKIRKA